MDDRLEREAALHSLSIHSEDLLRSCKENVDMLDSFEELEIITEEEKDDVNDSENYSSVIDKLRTKIDDDPSFFESFCQHIKKVDELGSLADSLLGTSSAILVTGQLAMTPIADHQHAATRENTGKLLESNTLSPSDDDIPVKSKIDGQVKKLREQLIVLQEIPSESEKTKESKATMMQTAIKTFITTSLDMGFEVHTIQMVLENLHSKDTDIVIDGDTYQWCITETKRQHALRNPESSCIEQVPEMQPFSEVNFCKVVVQNSLLACHLLGCSESRESEHLAYPHSLSEVNKSEFLSLDGKEEKISQPKDEFLESCSVSDIESSTASDSKLASPKENDREVPWPLLSPRVIQGAPVHQYLIAKGVTKPDGHEIYYMAFSSHQNLKEWSYGHISFEDGFRKQLEQLPIQFILERLWEGASVILTGFSFGGILAHLCATHLWSLSQGICPELLENNLLCITFGQPVIPLPRAANFADRVADKSRFHAIYIDDDIIPRMMRFLDPVSTKLKNPTCGLPEKFKSQHSPEKNFQNELSASIIEQLATLQEYKEEHVHTNMQRVVHHIERRIYQKIDEKLGGHPTSEKVLQQLTKRRHRNSDGPKSSLDALQDLRGVLQHVKRHRSNVIPSHITFNKVGAHGLVECKNSDFEFAADEEIREDMFGKHHTKGYLEVIKNQYVMKPKPVEFDEPESLLQSNFINPTLKRLEIHHFSHHKSAALSLDGDNLCFTYEIVLYLHKSRREYKISVDQKESVSSRSIQKHQVVLDVPRELATPSDGNDYQETEETAYICLYTHFGEFYFKDVEVKHKKFHISCRKQQVANLSIAEVIELSFLGALLERNPHDTSQSLSHTSKRFKVIQDFLKTIVDVIPIESAFSCIANTSSNQNASHLCRTLKRAEIKPPLSSSFFINAGLAITKLRGEAVQFDQATTLEDLFHVFVVTARKRASSSLLWFRQPTPDESKYLKWFGPDVASNSGENCDIVKYLQMVIEDAIKASREKIPAISGISVKSLFEDTEKLNKRENGPMATRLPAIKSPKSLLREGRSDLLKLQTNTRDTLKRHPSSEKDSEMSSTKAHNTMLLDYVNRLRNEELHLCIQIIIAFMEEYVRIPISDFNLTVSYWQLLKLGLGIFRRKVSKNIVTQYVSVSKHIRSIADETGHIVPPYETERNAANSKYAGKLQFLLSASLRHDEPLLVDDKFLVYSLESHLYWRFAHSTVPEHQRIDDSTSLEKIEENWDVLFKDVGLSTIVPSHRRLIARWLKFSLMIHKLRTELSCHTSVGVVGLVNSGKSTLVKELFQIKAIETGTREEKRTTVPFLYGIKGVENFDVIDFPGVDDQDDSISDLVNLIRTLSQLVVFVVNYRNAHTGAAVEWCKKLNQYAIPHLVCLTHGDRLYAECADEEQNEWDSAHAKKAIKKQVKIIRDKIAAKASDSPLRSLELYSLKVDNDSLLKSDEGQQNIRDAGIKGIKDVGRWIVKSLEEHLKEYDTANALKREFEMSRNGL